MPGELRDPEQLFPYHYDPRYEKFPNPTEQFISGIHKYIQSIALEHIGVPLSPEKLSKIKEELEKKGLFHYHPADENFRDEVRSFIDKIKISNRILYARSQ